MNAPHAPPSEGQPVDRLLAEVYAALKRLAHARLLARPRSTLQTTELVHEVFLRMSHDESLRFPERAQFRASALGRRADY
jgi:hypothetical protein